MSNHPIGEAVICTGHHHVQLAVLKMKVFSWKIKFLKVFMCNNSIGRGNNAIRVCC
jgi:hypothetical protein